MVSCHYAIKHDPPGRASTFLSWVMITSFRAVRTSMAPKALLERWRVRWAIAPSTRRCSFRDEVVLPGLQVHSRLGNGFLATDAFCAICRAAGLPLFCLALPRCLPPTHVLATIS